MSNAIFGWDNNLLGAALTAGSESAELSVSNLASEHGDPASAWQTGTGVRTWRDGAWFVGAMPANRRWRAFCLARSNLTAAARVRWRVGPRDSIVERTPVVDLDFAPGWTPPAGASFTRASSAWYFDATGTLTEAANHAPRLAYDPVTLAYLGLLFEPGHTNAIRNPRGEGAVTGTPGTAPTNWAISAAANGVDRTITGGVSEDGIPATDVRWTGTPTTSFVRYHQFEAIGAVAAAAGETWTLSVFLRLAAGAPDNFNVVLAIDEQDAGGTTLRQHSATITVTDAPLRTQRFIHTVTLAEAGTASIRPRLAVQFTNGLAVDATLRIGAPQLERSVFPTTPILPPVGAPAAATRAYERFFWSPGGDFVNSPGGGALLAEYIVANADANPTFPPTSIARLDDGTDNNIVVIRVTGAPAADALLLAVDGTWYANLTDIAITPGATCRTVVAWTDSLYTGATNGTAHDDDTTIVPPSALTRLQLPIFTVHQIYMRRVVVYNPELSAASLRQASIDGTTLEPATYDSGWLEDGVAGAAAQRVHVAPTEVVGQYVRCDIDDPSNPDGFVRVALAYAGPAWQPRVNIHPETGFVPERVAREARTRGGQTWYELLWAERAWEVSHQWTEDAEVWAQLLAMDQAASLGRNILFVPFPASADANREAVFGPMRLLAPVGFIAPGTKLRTWRARFSERL